MISTISVPKQALSFPRNTSTRAISRSTAHGATTYNSPFRPLQWGSPSSDALTALLLAPSSDRSHWTPPRETLVLVSTVVPPEWRADVLVLLRSLSIRRPLRLDALPPRTLLALCESVTELTSDSRRFARSTACLSRISRDVAASWLGVPSGS
jgi:hypothetical protein